MDASSITTTQENQFLTHEKGRRSNDVRRNVTLSFMRHSREKKLQNFINNYLDYKRGKQRTHKKM